MSLHHLIGEKRLLDLVQMGKTIQSRAEQNLQIIRDAQDHLRLLPLPDDLSIEVEFDWDLDPENKSSVGNNVPLKLFFGEVGLNTKYFYFTEPVPGGIRYVRCDDWEPIQTAAAVRHLELFYSVVEDILSPYASKSDNSDSDVEDQTFFP